jgi:hypothetical protein
MPTVMKNRPSRRPRNGVGDHQAGDERAERHRQAGLLGGEAGAEHEQDSGRGEHLVGVDRGDEAEHRAQQVPSDDHHHERHQDRLGERERERAGERAAATAERLDQHQQRSDREILDQEDRDRDPAELGQRAAEVGDHPQDHRGRGQRERAADHDRLAARQAQAAADQRDAGAGDQQLGQRQRVDPGTEQAQALDLELEAEVEQQEHDPQLGERPDRFEVLDETEPRGPDRRAADQKTEHGAEAGAHEQRGERHEDREDDQRFPQSFPACLTHNCRAIGYRGGALRAPAAVVWADAWSGSGHAGGESGGGGGELGDDLGIGPAGTLQDVERVIGPGDHVEGRALAQAGADGAQQVEIGELVALALEEQHRHADLGQMGAALDRRPAGGVQRKAEEHQAALDRERCLGGGERGHSSAHRLAAGEQRQVRRRRGRRGDRGAHGRKQDRARVRSPAARLQVRKLVAEGGDSDLSERRTHRPHEPMAHARPCPMREYQQRARRRWPQQQRRHLALVRRRQEPRADRLDLTHEVPLALPVGHGDARHLGHPIRSAMAGAGLLRQAA